MKLNFTVNAASAWRRAALYTALFHRRAGLLETCLFALCLGLAGKLAAGPTVTNVRAVQRVGTPWVDIDYDLVDPDSATLVVSVDVSEDGGGSYAVSATNFVGAIGSPMVPGTDKRISWNAGVDWPNKFSSTIRFRVSANSVSTVPVKHSGMAWIPEGPFQMGDSFQEGNANELPVHPVDVSGFYMDQFEVTKALWDKVKGWSLTNGYTFDGLGLGKATDHPVHSVSWFDAVKWCNARSEKEGRVPAYYTDREMTLVYKTGKFAPFVKWEAGYRLPTEAEWEKAARGGDNARRFPWSDSDAITHSRANYISQASYPYDVSPTRFYHPKYATGGIPYTSPVGSFGANGYGLFDMAGNVNEWCWDFFGAYPSTSELNPRGPNSGTYRVVRGGSWNTLPIACRSAYRVIVSPDFSDDRSNESRSGFRTALPLGQPSAESNLTTVDTRASGPINNPPTLNPILKLGINEDAPEQTIPLTGISTGETNTLQTLTIRAVSDNPALIGELVVSHANQESTGTLSFKPLPNANGTATITVTVTDNGGTAAGGIDTVSRQFTVTVAPVNDPPSFVKGADITVDENSREQNIAAWATKVVAGPTNEATQRLRFTLTVPAESKALFFGVSGQPTLRIEDGRLKFTPAANTHGSATVMIVLEDLGGTANGGKNISPPQFLNITVRPNTGFPNFAKGDDLVADEGSGPRIFPSWASEITSGTAGEGTTNLEFTVTVPQESQGLFLVQPTLGRDGTLSFTPAVDNNGTADIAVVLRSNKSQNSSSAQFFAITVQAVNDPPSFVKGDDIVVDEDSGPQSFVGWATAIKAGPADEGNQKLQFRLTVPAESAGLFLVSPSLSPDGTLEFTPAAEAHGTATLTVTLDDDGGTANAGTNTSSAQHFTITMRAVNDPPNFVKGADISVDEDSGPQRIVGWATGINSGPANEGNQRLKFTVAAPADSAGLFLVPPSLSDDGTLAFTPAPNGHGTATIAILLEDEGGIANGGQNTSPAQFVSITVGAVNDPPGFVKGADIAVDEDSGPQSFAAWATGIHSGTSDEGTQKLKFTVTVPAENAGLFLTPPSLSADGTLTFTPAANSQGSATVAIALEDDGGTANGGQNTSPAQLATITVRAVNDAPGFLKGADIAVDEDSGPQSFAFWATGITSGPTDEGNQKLKFTVTVPAENAGLFLTPPSLSADGTLTFTPAANSQGSATVAIVLEDDGGTANGGQNASPTQLAIITVRAVNGSPSFVKGADITVDEDSGPQSFAAWATGITSGPSDEGNQKLKFTVTVPAESAGLFLVPPTLSADGTLTFTPAANGHGTTPVAIVLEDDGGTANGGQNASPAQLATITVRAVNDSPSFVKGADITVDEDSGPQSFAAWATGITSGPSDEGNQKLKFTVTVPAESAGLFLVPPTLSADGTLTFTPAANSQGTATMSIALEDDGGTANGGQNTSPAQLATITVRAVNDSPAFVKGADITVDEDSGPQTFAAWATGITSGPANEGSQKLKLIVTVPAESAGLFSTPPALSADGTLTFTPAPNQHGAATVAIVLEDDGGTANGGQNTSPAQLVTLTVRAVNDSPAFVKGADIAVDEDSGPQSFAAWATGITSGPADEGSQKLKFIVTTPAESAALFSTPPALSADGTLTFTPAPNQHGAATVAIVLEDDGGTANGGQNASPTQFVTLTVKPPISLPPPIVELTSPTTDEVFGVGDPILLFANASAPGGTLVQVEFFMDETYSLGVVTEAPFSLAQTELPEGPHELHAVATDSRGVSTKSAAVTVTIGRPCRAIGINFQTAWLPEEAEVGTPLTLTITPGNNGECPAYGVVIEVTLAHGLEFVSAFSPEPYPTPTHADGVVRFPIGVLQNPGGQDVSLTAISRIPGIRTCHIKMSANGVATNEYDVELAVAGDWMPILSIIYDSPGQVLVSVKDAQPGTAYTLERAFSDANMSTLTWQSAGKFVFTSPEVRVPDVIQPSSRSAFYRVRKSE